MKKNNMGTCDGGGGASGVVVCVNCHRGWLSGYFPKKLQTK